MLLSEEELTENWDDWDPNEPVVSVICCTYNQEMYIEDALKGFFSQKTDFPFEVIIQNDASTDTTKEIIDRWYEEYSNVLKPYHHEENQFSQGHKPGPIAIGRSMGEFIAMCEGDDYWTDSLKLQRQYDALQRHPNIDLCFHPAKEYRNEKFCRVICKHFDEEAIVTLEQVIEGGGGYMPTASLMIRKSSIYPFPDWFIEKAPVGDAFLQVMGSQSSGALFLPEVCSAYRLFAVGSRTVVHSFDKNLSAEEIICKIDNYIWCYCQVGADFSHGDKSAINNAVVKLLRTGRALSLGSANFSLARSYNRKLQGREQGILIMFAMLLTYMPGARFVLPGLISLYRRYKGFFDSESLRKFF